MRHAAITIPVDPVRKCRFITQMLSPPPGDNQTILSAKNTRSLFGLKKKVFHPKNRQPEQ